MSPFFFCFTSHHWQNTTSSLQSTCNSLMAWYFLKPPIKYKTTDNYFYYTVHCEIPASHLFRTCTSLPKVLLSSFIILIVKPFKWKAHRNSFLNYEIPVAVQTMPAARTFPSEKGWLLPEWRFSCSKLWQINSYLHNNYY